MPDVSAYIVDSLISNFIYLPTDEWTKKLWYIYTVEYYSAIKRKALDSVLIRWMPIIQTEVSQKEKDKYRILVHMESRKMVLMSLLQGSNGDADIENRLLDTVGEGEGGTNGKSSIRTYTLPYATLDSQGEFAA